MAVTAPLEVSEVTLPVFLVSSAASEQCSSPPRFH